MSPEECIDKLENLIFDEELLVTYKLLSKELKIHVNEAKKCLYDFLLVQESKEEIKLYAYYFISGLVERNGEKVHKLVIVSQENLENVKKQFQDITSCHIYSIHKGGPRDVSSLYNCQSWCKKWAEEHREFAAIKHPNIIIQAPVIKKVEAKKIDFKSQTPASIKQVKSDNTSTFFKKTQDKSDKSCSAVTNGEQTHKTENITENNDNKDGSSNHVTLESKDSNKGTLASMWQKLEDKSKSGKNENSKPDTKGKTKAATKSVGKNNIMSMFSKQAEKNASNPVKKAPTNLPLPNDTDKITDKLSSPKKQPENISPKLDSHVEKKVNLVKNKKKTSRKQAKRSKQQSDNESDEDFKPKKKKHRRICTMDDSDSESENEEEQDKAQRSILTTEEPVVETSMNISDDNEEPIPPTPPVINNKGKQKVWKTVNKTFEDEEGFLVSKQEKVLVAASDSDEEPVPSEKVEIKTHAKQNTFSYRKQASLTSFFKQK